MQYENKNKYVVAVSGGPDSMALLSMMLEKNCSLVVAFVNYHTRKESDKETFVMHFLRKYTLRKKLPL